MGQWDREKSGTVGTLREYYQLFRKIIRNKSKSEEGKLCHRIAIALRNMSLDGKEIVWFHVPNESNGGVRFGSNVNSIGRIAGAPDYVLISPNETILMEVKTGRGRLSDSQKMFSKWCEVCGVKYRIVRSFEEFERLVGNI